MTATIDQIIAAKSDRGILARCQVAAEMLDLPMGAARMVNERMGSIVSAEVPDGGGSTTSIAYALDYHRTDMTAAVNALNAERSGKPPIPLDLSKIGEDPMGVSDAIIIAAVTKVLQPS